MGRTGTPDGERFLRTGRPSFETGALSVLVK
jgi:hypothetical protein